MSRKKLITSEDILKGRTLSRHAIEPTFVPQKSRITSLYERFYLALTVAGVVFLSASFFFPDAMKANSIFISVCVFLACFSSVHLLILCTEIEISATIGELISWLIYCLIEWFIYK